MESVAGAERCGVTRKETVEAALRVLVGLRLQRTYHILDTRVFQFWPDSREVGETYRLIVQCPWRLEELDHIVTGSEDARCESSESESTSESGASVASTSALGHHLAECWGSDNEEGEVRDSLRISSVTADAIGGLRIGVGPYTLAVFPSGTVNEYWRLATEAWHFVVEANRIVRVCD
jgi:hypothetical protein